MNSDRRIFSPKKQIQALRHNGHTAKKERRKLRTSTETFSSPASSGLDLRIQSQTSWRNSALSDVTWHPIKKNHFLVCTEGIFKSLFPSSSLSIAPYRSFDTSLLHGEDSWISRCFYEKAEYLDKKTTDSVRLRSTESQSMYHRERKRCQCEPDSPRCK